VKKARLARLIILLPQTRKAWGHSLGPACKLPIKVLSDGSSSACISFYSIFNAFGVSETSFHAQKPSNLTLFIFKIFGRIFNFQGGAGYTHLKINLIRPINRNTSGYSDYAI
jgi:hypothetical protein